MSDLQPLVDELAALLGRAVTIDDPKLRLLAHSAHQGPVDEHRVHSIMQLRASPEAEKYVFGPGIVSKTRPFRVPAHKGMALLARLGVPIRFQNAHLGFLWLIDDDESLTEQQLEECVRTAARAGEALYRGRLKDDRRRARERELFESLISSSATERSAGASELARQGTIEASEQCRVLLVAASARGRRRQSVADRITVESALRRGLNRPWPIRGIVMSRNDGLGYALIAHPPSQTTVIDPLEVARKISAEVSESLDQDIDVGVGIGPVVDVSNAHLSFRRAQHALRIRDAIPEFGEIVEWDALGVYQTLVALPPDELNASAIPAGLRALLEAGAGDNMLLDTLECFLGSAGNVQKSASALHVHRATLYYRLARIEEITGCSLASGDDRLLLHLGIKIARLLREIPAPAERQREQ
ncbi:PucR family transcriptional regulator [Microbacterium sp. NPDC058342]|uniref:PucR family transcriptional regulator n=1 Tax=Microbacterium sp. NPDC058342 TaxID=3346454 RepID=UPI00366630F8